MNKNLCHVQDIVLLRIVVLQHLGILRMVYRRVVFDLNWPVCYRSHGSHELWFNTLMGHMGLGQTILTHCQH